jgi:hypothetical protein
MSGTELMLVQIPGFGTDMVGYVHWVFAGLVVAIKSGDEKMVCSMIDEVWCAAMISCVGILQNEASKWNPHIAKVVYEMCEGTAAMSHLCIPTIRGSAVINSNNAANITTNGYSLFYSALMALMFATSNKSNDDPIVERAGRYVSNFCNALLGPIKSMVISCGGNFFKPCPLLKVDKRRDCIGLLLPDNVNPELERTEVKVKRPTLQTGGIIDSYDNANVYDFIEHPTVDNVASAIGFGARSFEKSSLSVVFLDQGELSSMVWERQFNDEVGKGWFRDPHVVACGDGFQFSCVNTKVHSVFPPIHDMEVEMMFDCNPSRAVEYLLSLRVSGTMHRRLGMTCIPFSAAQDAVDEGEVMAGRLKGMLLKIEGSNIGPAHLLKDTSRRSNIKGALIDTKVTEMNEAVLVPVLGDTVLIRADGGLVSKCSSCISSEVMTKSLISSIGGGSVSHSTKYTYNNDKYNVVCVVSYIVCTVPWKLSGYDWVKRSDLKFNHKSKLILQRSFPELLPVNQRLLDKPNSEQKHSKTTKAMPQKQNQRNDKPRQIKQADKGGETAVPRERKKAKAPKPRNWKTLKHKIPVERKDD